MREYSAAPLVALGTHSRPHLFPKHRKHNTSRPPCIPSWRTHVILFLYVPKVILLKTNVSLSPLIDIESSWKPVVCQPWVSVGKNTLNRTKQIEIDFMYYYDCLPPPPPTEKLLLVSETQLVTECEWGSDTTKPRADGRLRTAGVFRWFGDL